MEIKVNEVTAFKVMASGKGQQTEINADVSVERGIVTNITDGTVNDGNGASIANFQYYGTASIQFVTTDLTKMLSAVTDINAFVEACKNNITSMPTVTAEKPSAEGTESESKE